MHRDDQANSAGSSHTTSGSSGPGGEVIVETAVTEIWKSLLGLPQISIDDNFFEIGGTSLLATLLLKRINSAFERALPIATVFEHATVRAQAALLRGESAAAPASSPSAGSDRDQTGSIPRTVSESPAIAIIGIPGRFPGAESVEEFWKNLCDGVESITFFDRDELEPSDRIVAEQNENYVAARPLLKDPEMFDAEFFGVYPKEAAQMDPQHRIFLECAWEVLERAGYAPNKMQEPVGVFAGCSMNTYFMRNLAAQPGDQARGFLEEFTGAYQVGNYATMLGNDKDFLPTRISYKLNLHGPSISVQSACSTALVAVAQAAQSLVTGQCEMALAGAVS